MSDEVDRLLASMSEEMKVHLTTATRLALATSAAELLERLGPDHRIPDDQLTAVAGALCAWFDAGWRAGSTDAVAQAAEQGVKIMIVERHGPV